jgi:hypothetical protein
MSLPMKQQSRQPARDYGSQQLLQGVKGSELLCIEGAGSPHWHFERVARECIPDLCRSVAD